MPLAQPTEVVQIPDMIKVPGTNVTLSTEIYERNKDIFKGVSDSDFCEEALRVFKVLEATQKVFGPRLQELMEKRVADKEAIDKAQRIDFPKAEIIARTAHRQVTSMSHETKPILTKAGPELIAPLRNSYMAVKAAQAQSEKPEIVSTVFDSEDAGHYATTIDGLLDVWRVRNGYLKGTKEPNKDICFDGQKQRPGVMWMRYNGLGSCPFPVDEIAIGGKPVDRTILEAVFDISNGIKHVSSAKDFAEAVKIGPKAYIPKMVNAAEAEFIDLLFRFIEQENGVTTTFPDFHPAHAKVALVLETSPIFYELNAVAAALSKRLIKTSFGRYDALANAISVNSANETKVPPGPGSMGVNTAPATAQIQQMIQVANRWGFMPLGGMDVAVGGARKTGLDSAILGNIRQLKAKEGELFDSFWISAPHHATVAMEGLEEGKAQREQTHLLDIVIARPPATADELNELPTSKVTEGSLAPVQQKLAPQLAETKRLFKAGDKEGARAIILENRGTVLKGTLTTRELRGIIRKELEFTEGYLQGIGCCSYLDLVAGPPWPTMEDFATAGEYTIKAPWMWYQTNAYAIDELTNNIAPVRDLIPIFIEQEVTAAKARYDKFKVSKDLGDSARASMGPVDYEFYKEAGDLLLNAVKNPRCPDIAKDEVVYPEYLRLRGRDQYLEKPGYTFEEQEHSRQELGKLQIGLAKL